MSELRTVEGRDLIGRLGRNPDRCVSPPVVQETWHIYRARVLLFLAISCLPSLVCLGKKVR